MRSLVVYSVLRIGLFVVVYLVVRALGAQGVLALLLAAVVSLGLSYVLLRRQRESVARALLERRTARSGEGFSEFLRSDAEAEDAAADAASGTAPRRDRGHRVPPAAQPGPAER